MLPHRPGDSSQPSSGSARRPVSDKEEIARAALRSLAEPGDSTITGDPALPQRPPLPTPSDPSAHQLQPPSKPAQSSSEAHPRSFHGDIPRHGRAPHADAASMMHAQPTLALHDEPDRFSASMTRGSSSSSLRRDPPLVSSPEPSPTLGAMTALPAPAHPRHSVPTITSQRQLHETALRRASVALGVNLEDVRQIVQQAYASRRTSHSSSTASSPASNQAYLTSSSSAMDRPAGFVRQVLDAYDLESDWASQSRSSYDVHSVDQPRASGSSQAAERGLAASGIAWHEATRPSNRPPPYNHYPQTDRSHLVAWGSRPDARLPTFQSRLAESSSRSAHAASRDTRWYEPSSAAAIARSGSAAGAVVPPQRPESPSPFAYDAYRRSSNPATLEPPAAYPARPAAVVSRASYGSVRDAATSYAAEGAPGWPVQPQSNSVYQRRVRSIDDYAEQHLTQQHDRHRSGSMSQHTIHAPGLVEPDEERLPDRSIRSSFRHAYQPYPSQSNRYAQGLSTSSMSHAPSDPPQLSPTAHEPQRYRNLSQLRSPAAETSISIASPPSTSAAALTPSPLFEVTSLQTARFMPDNSKRTSGHEIGPPSPLRRDSEDPLAESTRAGVEHMQIDDSQGTSEPRSLANAARKSRGSRADRSSAPIQNTDLSHSEIMQKLQDKVKSRLAAKGTPVPVATLSKSKLRASSSLKSSTRRGSKLGRAGSIKRSASSISTSSESADRASAPAAATRVSRDDSPGKETVVAQESASPSAGAPAAKVRRTSVSNQSVPVASQLAPRSASTVPLARDKSPPKTIEEAIAKSASPKPSQSTSASPGQKDVHTPLSIEAALLSPTDTPTPSEAAANHAQRLSRSPLPPESVVESASGQALPVDLPGAGQMNAGSATKQQASGADSLVQAAQTKDPTETSSAIA